MWWFSGWPQYQRIMFQLCIFERTVGYQGVPMFCPCLTLRVEQYTHTAILDGPIGLCQPMMEWMKMVPQLELGLWNCSRWLTVSTNTSRKSDVSAKNQKYCSFAVNGYKTNTWTTRISDKHTSFCFVVVVFFPIAVMSTVIDSSIHVH